MKSKPVLALCAAASAVLGAGLGLYRSSLIAKCTDPATGRLFLQSAGTFTPFFAAAGVCVLLFFALSFPARRIPLHAGLRPAGTGAKTARVAAAFLLFAAAALLLTQAGAFTALSILKSLFLLSCGGAVLVSVKARSVQEKAMCSLFPLFFTSIYLLSFYRDSARNPLTYTFAFEILSVIALLLALYLSACLWFGKKRPGPLLFFAMAATFGTVAVSAGTLLDRAFFRLYLPVGPADAVMACALVLWVWLELFDAVRPLPPQPEAAAPHAEEGPEEPGDLQQ